MDPVKAAARDQRNKSALARAEKAKKPAPSEKPAKKKASN